MEKHFQFRCNSDNGNKDILYSIFYSISGEKLCDLSLLMMLVTSCCNNWSVYQL